KADDMQALVKQLAAQSGERLVVAGNDGKIVADSEDKLIGKNLDLPSPPPQKPGTAPMIVFDKQAPGGSAGSFGVGVPFTQPVTLPMTKTTGAMGFYQSDSVSVFSFSTSQDTPAFLPLVGIQGAQTGHGVTVAGGPNADFVVARVPAGADSNEAGFLNSVNR